MTSGSIMAPPAAFDPVTDTLGTETVLCRVHHRRFGPAQMNPGTDVATQASRVGSVYPVARFSFFPDGSRPPAPVPVLYAAMTPHAALWETVLRNRRPQDKSPVTPDTYETLVLSHIRPTREMHVASFAGADMSRFGIPQNMLIEPGPQHYGETIAWARAAWSLGLDGVKYVSRRDHSSLAYVFFGRDSGTPMFTDAPEAGPARHLGDRGEGFEWFRKALGRWRLIPAL